MIIDVHNHIVAGEQLQTFQAGLINSAGFHRPGGVVVTEKHIQEAKWRGHKHSEVLDEVGTDFAERLPERGNKKQRGCGRIHECLLARRRQGS